MNNQNGSNHPSNHLMNHPSNHPFMHGSPMPYYYPYPIYQGPMTVPPGQVTQGQMMMPHGGVSAPPEVAFRNSDVNTVESVSDCQGKRKKSVEVESDTDPDFQPSTSKASRSEKKSTIPARKSSNAPRKRGRPTLKELAERERMEKAVMNVEEDVEEGGGDFLRQIQKMQVKKLPDPFPSRCIDRIDLKTEDDYG